MFYTRLDRTLNLLQSLTQSKPPMPLDKTVLGNEVIFSDIPSMPSLMRRYISEQKEKTETRNQVH